MDATSYLRRYSTSEGRGILQRFDRKALLQLATDKATLQFHARGMLLEHLHTTFSDFGLSSPAGFYNILQGHDAVVSGSFVPAFIDALYHLREASKKGDGSWAQGARVQAV